VAHEPAQVQRWNSGGDAQARVGLRQRVELQCGRQCQAVTANAAFTAEFADPVGKEREVLYEMAEAP
jgi:hypothetical protein